MIRHLQLQRRERIYVTWDVKNNIVVIEKSHVKRKYSHAVAAKDPYRFISGHLADVYEKNNKSVHWYYLVNNFISGTTQKDWP